MREGNSGEETVPDRAESLLLPGEMCTPSVVFPSVIESVYSGEEAWFLVLGSHRVLVWGQGKTR